MNKYSSLDNLLSKLKKYKETTNGFQALCPAHDDHVPSLSISKGTDGKILLKCHAGCNTKDVVAAIGLKMTDLYPTPSHKAQKPKIVAVYDYCNEDGDLLFQSVRYEPKDFNFRRPNGKGGWLWNLKDVRRVLYRLPNILRNDNVIIVEGEKDADALFDLGFAATTSPMGADCWREEYTKFLIDKNVIIIPDNDNAGRKHARKIAKSLWGKAATVKIVELTGLAEKEDVSDFLKNNSKEDLTKIIDATPFLTDLDFAEKGDKNIFGDKKVPAPVIANHLMKLDSYIHTNGILMRYKNGIYLSGAENYIRKQLREILGERYLKRISDEVIHNIQIETSIDNKNIDSNENMLNVKNGLLNLNSEELNPHSNVYLSISQLPVAFNPNAKPPEIDSFLKDILPPDALEFVDEFFGYLLLPNARFQKAFMLKGEGANGKGTFINMIEQFLGSHNISNVPLQELDENRFKRAMLFGKRANIFADLDRRALKGTSYFKTIVAGDLIDAELKHKDCFTFRPYCKLIFSANEFPETPDTTYGFFRRWIVIPFPNRFEGKNDNPDIIKKLTTEVELSGLLNRALKGLRRLIANNGFSEPPSIIKAKAVYLRKSDSAFSFLLETVKEGTDLAIKKAELYENYIRWCSELNLIPQSNAKFNQKVQDLYSVEEWRQDGRIRYWKGIDLLRD